MGKVDRLPKKVEPFASLFWALGIVCTCQHLTLPPARHHSTIAHKACPYMVMLPVRCWRVGSILNEDALPPPLPI